MNEDIFNILTNSNSELDNQKLLDYLNGKLSIDEQHEVEKLMMDNEFMNDAVEGLEKMHNKEALKAYVEQINERMHKQLENKSVHREKRRLQISTWLYFTIVLILLLCLIGFLVIRQYLH